MLVPSKRLRIHKALKTKQKKNSNNERPKLTLGDSLNLKESGRVRHTRHNVSKNLEQLFQNLSSVEEFSNSTDKENNDSASEQPQPRTKLPHEEKKKTITRDIYRI